MILFIIVIIVISDNMINIFINVSVLCHVTFLMSLMFINVWHYSILHYCRRNLFGIYLKHHHYYKLLDKSVINNITKYKIHNMLKLNTIPIAVLRRVLYTYITILFITTITKIVIYLNNSS